MADAEKFESPDEEEVILKFPAPDQKIDDIREAPQALLEQLLDEVESQKLAA